MNESGFDFSDIISAFRRRAWLLVASIVVITPIVLLIALLLPPYYTSTARILVQGQQIPSDLVRSTVNFSPAERLALIQQRLTTRRNLLAMAERLQLFEDQTKMSQTDIVAALRSAIEVEEIALQTGSTRSRQVQAAAFTVSYSSRNPVLAARVANELVTMVLQENVETRSRRASETRQFLQRKVRELATALDRIEGQIANFKAENAASLPFSLAERQVELQALVGRRYEMEKQRVTLEEQKSALMAAIATGAPLEGDQSSMSPEERELDRMKQQLAQASGIYSENHPRIRNLKSSIASLEQAVADKLAAVERLVAENGGNQEGQRDVLRKSRQERSASLLDRQLELLVQEIEKVEERTADLRRSITETPDTEVALASLMRDRADLILQHQAAVQKEATAADGEELEVNRQAERFEIMEQAQIPEAPNSPPRKLIAIGGFGGSIVFGIALIFLLEMMNRTIRTSKHLVAQVGLAPIVTIPIIRTSQEQAKRRVTTGVYLLALIGLGAGMIFLVDQYVTPVDVLVTNLMDDAHLTPVVEQARERFAGTLESLGNWFRSLFGGA